MSEHSKKLFEAVFRTDYDKINKLINEGADINAVNYHGFGLLHKAAFRNYKEVIGFLLDREADINAVGGHDKCTALHIAVQNCCVESLNLLLKRGADINAKVGEGNDKGCTALHLAAFDNNY
ncbi:ankyrin repeat domain-containing protein [Wolbachia endosymbiont of Pentidionis agamae]|uniref:ankyrin repeat domain-containing protein n=1 Tax=Wolbachia endosymbiont of Pentidionis agamae TaxID=3110435 RepID=UPI002FD09614